MSDEALTESQARVLSAIRRRARNGEPAPSYRELCDEFSWRSTGTVRDHLRALARKGYLELSGAQHRRLRLTEEHTSSLAEVPLVGVVAAGSPVTADENLACNKIAAPSHWTRGASCFALRVAGDSMVDAGIREGDCVVVRRQNAAADGDIVVATIDGATTLKRLAHNGSRTVLAPENHRYQPIVVETESSVIQGVVVGLLREYRPVGRSRPSGGKSRTAP